MASIRIRSLGMDRPLAPAKTPTAAIAALVARAGDWAAADDPVAAALPFLRKLRLLELPLRAAPGVPAGRALLEALRDIGRCELSVGRVFEGHCNAAQLVEIFGTAQQRRRVREDLANGLLLGVWNTDASDAVTLVPVPDGRLRLSGTKKFCSGAGQVGLAIVTASLPQGGKMSGKVMCLVPTGAPVVADCSTWQPLGMAASASGSLCFDGVMFASDRLLGRPGDYERQPWFSGGAVRFAAVQLGGAEALLEITVRHLRATNRADDPYQIARVGALATAIEGGRAWLARAAEISDRARDAAAIDIVARHADMVRTAIERSCLDALELATRSVGLAGLMQHHPLQRIVRDLTTYLRQPNPDGALAAVGAYIATTPGATESAHFDG